MATDISLRTTFDAEVELYNKARPAYPDELFEALVHAAHLTRNAHLLEIGPGTGLATIPLATRGFVITGVELGSGMATAVRKRLAVYPNVTIINSAFESARLPSGSFDLIYAATAFHWIQPEIRFSKPHRLLKPHGHLAIIHTNHLSDGAGDVFYETTKPIYDHYLPGNNVDSFNLTANTGKALPTSDQIEPSELDNMLFKLSFFEVFPLTITYTTQQYLDLIATYSVNLALPATDRQKFLAEMRQLIDQQFAGQVTKHFGMSLTVGTKR